MKAASRLLHVKVITCIQFTCFTLPGVPTAILGAAVLSSSLCVLSGSPPKKLPTLTLGMAFLKRSYSAQICSTASVT